MYEFMANIMPAPLNSDIYNDIASPPESFKTFGVLFTYKISKAFILKEPYPPKGYRSVLNAHTETNVERSERRLNSLFTAFHTFGTGVEFGGLRMSGRHLTFKGETGMMIETLVVVLLVLWLVGLVLGQTFGGIWHALLLVAVVMFAYRLITDRRVA